MREINVDEILRPYYKQNKGGLDEWIDYYDAKQAIKEIASQIIDACAEEAEIKYNWNPLTFADNHEVDKDSIKNVYNQIKL